MGVQPIYRPNARGVLRALPFLLMGAVAVADVLTGPATGLVPLLSLGPAFAAVFHSLRGTVLIGATALALCAISALFESNIGARTETLAFVTVAGVTAAAVVAGAARQRRDRQLTTARTVAEVAQRVVLRPVPAAVGPVSFAVRYLSATAQAQIGGDLYEVLPGADGTRLIIGDVTGKGLAAVQTAAAVLSAFRTAADQAASLESIAGRIEASLLRQAAEEEFVTAVLAHVSPDGAKISLLNCGHPAPLLLAAGTPPRFADAGSNGLPLGLSGLADTLRHVTAVALAPGDALLFYTDGISEACDRGGAHYPLAECCAALDRRDPDAALGRLLDNVLRHAGHSLGDDGALLMLSRAAA